jgi:hypothetical protein
MDRDDLFYDVDTVSRLGPGEAFGVRPSAPEGWRGFALQAAGAVLLYSIDLEELDRVAPKELLAALQREVITHPASK